MKQHFLACGLALSLAACGGGGSSSASTTPPDDTLTGISNPTSPTYTGSLKTFAEVWTGFDLAGSLNDLVLFAGQSGNCAGGGSLSYNGTSTQTLTKCVRKYPADNAYTGTYTGSGNASALTLSGFNVNVLDPATVNQASPTVQFKITGGSLTGNNTTTAAGADVTKLTGGAATFSVGASAYTVSNLNTSTINDGTSFTVDMNGVTPITASVQKGAITYDTYFNQAVKTIGDARPSAGKITVTYATSTACSPLVIRMISTTQFGLSCLKDTSNTEKVKNWADADVIAALKAAQQ